MRNLIGIAVVLSILFIPGCYSRVVGGPSVSVSVTTEYSTCDYDDDMCREDLICINNTHVGFWLAIPGGGWVFRCRSMWYDTEWTVWRYGPWYNDYSIKYVHCHGYSKPCCPSHGIRFHVFMSKHYPKYHHKHFYWYYQPKHYYHKHYKHGGYGHGHGNKGHGHGGHGYRDERSDRSDGNASWQAAPEPRRDELNRSESPFNRSTIIQTNKSNSGGDENGTIFKLERAPGGNDGQIHRVSGGADSRRPSLGSDNPIRRNDARTQLGNR